MLKIRELRKAREVTQEELSKLTGISAACISRYECEKRGLDIKDAKIIANALGCKIDDLIDDKPA